MVTSFNEHVQECEKHIWNRMQNDSEQLTQHAGSHETWGSSHAKSKAANEMSPYPVRMAVIKNRL